MLKPYSRETSRSIYISLLELEYTSIKGLLKAFLKLIKLSFSYKKAFNNYSRDK